MGGKSQTTTQTQTNTPAGLSQLQDIWSRVQSAASTPYQAYGGQQVADLSGTQRAGIDAITAAQGSAMPYFNQAADYARTGASAIDPAAISRYQNPFTQQVVDATRADFNRQNAIQQNQLKGNAALKGALGGNRVGVMQAELAANQRRAQDPVIANLYSSGYDKALGAAQGDRAAAAQGAYTFGALAPSIQNAQISGAQAQIGAGGLEQGVDQAKLTAAFNDYLRAQAYPYQQAGFMASTGLPAVTSMGGTTTGTMKSPGPSPLGQIAGLGLAAAGAFTGNPMMAMGGLSSAFGGGSGGQSGFTGNTTNPFAGYSGATTSYMGGVPYPMFRASGGRVNGRPDRHRRFADTVGMIRQTLRNGGAVHGYAGGGVVDLSPNEYVDQGFGLTNAAIASGEFDPQGINSPAEGGFAAPSIVPQTPPVMNAGVPMPAPRPMAAPQGLPPVMTAGMEPEVPEGALAFSGGPQSPFAAGPANQPFPMQNTPTPAPESPRGGLFNLSDEARQGLIAAGLGMMASKSPFPLSAIGEGGLQGVKTFGEAKTRKDRIEAEARRLAQQASQFAQSHGLQRDQLAETVRSRKETLAETKRHREEMESRGKFTYLGPSADGTKSVFLNQIDGTTEERPVQIMAKPKADAGKPKPLTEPVRKELSKTGERYYEFNKLDAEFKPEYGGFYFERAGDAANWVAKNFGVGNKDAAEWWSNYQEQKNMIRNSLFGSALTKTEKSEFDKAAINPGMTADAIKRNLKRQKEAATRAAQKIAKFHISQGANPETVGAAMGIDVADIGLEKPAAAGPKKNEIDQQALDWANANPDDPRAAEIKKRLGAP